LSQKSGLNNITGILAAGCLAKHAVGILLSKYFDISVRNNP
jgi:hypothetical protein